MSQLLLKPQQKDKNGRVIHVTPESAGWKYVGFEVYSLKREKHYAHQQKRTKYVSFY